MAWADTPDITVEVAFGQDAKGFVPASATWTDLSARLRSGTARRGRPSDMDSLQAGTATLILDNLDDELTPGNRNSSYWPDIEPMTPLRIKYDGASAWVGFVERWTPRWPDGGWVKHAVVELGCVDAWKMVLDHAESVYPTIVAADGALHHWRFSTHDRFDSITEQYDLIAKSGDLGHSLDDGGGAPMWDADQSLKLILGVDTPYKYQEVAAGVSPTGGGQAATWEVWLKPPTSMDEAVPVTVLSAFDTSVTVYDFQINWGQAGYSTDPTRILNQSWGNYDTNAYNISDIPASFDDEEYWHHWVTTFDGTDQWDFYFDGQLATSFTWSYTLQFDDLYIGESLDTGYATVCRLAELAVYDTTLSSTQIYDHFRSFEFYGRGGQSLTNRLADYADVFDVATSLRNFTVGTNTYAGAFSMPKANRPIGEDIDSIMSALSDNFWIGRDGSWNRSVAWKRPTGGVIGAQHLAMPPQIHFELYDEPAATVADLGYDSGWDTRNAGTVSGGPTASADNAFTGVVRAGSWYFDGSDDQIQSAPVGGNLGLEGDTNPFYSVWVKPVDTGMICGLFKTGGGIRSALYWDATDEVFQFETDSDSLADLPGQTPGDYPAGVWYHVVAQPGSLGNGEWWVDGVSIGTWTAVHSAVASTDSLWVGRKAGGGAAFEGNIHDVGCGSANVSAGYTADRFEVVREILRVDSTWSTYKQVEIAYDDDNYYNSFNKNRYQIQGPDISRYGRRSWEVGDEWANFTYWPYETGGADVHEPGEWQFYKYRYRQLRVSELVLEPSGDPANTAAILGVELDDRLVVNVNTPGGETLEIAAYVDEIEDTFEPAIFQRRLSLSP